MKNPRRTIKINRFPIGSLSFPRRRWRPTCRYSDLPTPAGTNETRGAWSLTRGKLLNFVAAAGRSRLRGTGRETNVQLCAGNNILRHTRARGRGGRVQRSKSSGVNDRGNRLSTDRQWARRYAATEIRVRTFPRLYSGKCHRASATFDVAERGDTGWPRIRY